MVTWKTEFPEVLAKLHQLDFEFDDGNGIDFEPFLSFQSEEETSFWFKAWTGNDRASGHEFRIFGQDGTGGYAAFWIVHTEKSILDQPIVFMGSEGEMGVIAENFGNYLWLLAANIGPYDQ